MKLATLLRGLLATFTASASFAAFKAGVSRADITPLPGEVMTAMGGAEVKVEKIHDPLWANVIVFQNEEEALAIVSLDLIGTEHMDQIREEVREHTGIENVICVVSHTHGSGRSSATHADRILPLIVEAALAAQADLQPARIGFASGELNQGYNRRILQPDGSVEMMWNNRDRIPSGPTDDEVGVLVVRVEDSDEVIATLVNYAVHPVISMNFSELIISSDYPGVMAREVEAAVGGHCIYFMGAAGDINPFDADMFRYATSDEVFAQVKVVGHAVAQEVIKTVNSIEAYDTQPAINYRQSFLPMSDRSAGADAPKTRDIEVNTVLLGEDFAMVTIPGEVFVELGLDLKARSPAASTWLLGLANGMHWYIPTLQATTEGGYGATWGTELEVGAGERLILEALVSLHHQMDLIKPLR